VKSFVSAEQAINACNAAQRHGAGRHSPELGVNFLLHAVDLTLHIGCILPRLLVPAASRTRQITRCRRRTSALA